MSVAAIVARAFVCVLLLYSGLSKSTPAGRAATARMFGELGVRTGRGSLAVALTCAELVTAGLVAVPATVLAGGVAATGLSAVLVAGVAFVLHRRLSVTCSCFGGSASRLTGAHLARNVVMLGSAVLVLCSAFLPEGGPSGAELVVSVGAGGLLALLAARADDLLFAFGRSGAPAAEH